MTQRHQDVAVLELAGQYEHALFAGDVVEAEEVVRDAIEAGLSEEQIDDHLVAPAMRRIGDAWQLGEITVADEHLATQISLRVLALMRESFRVARARQFERVLLLGIEGEEHVLGLQMASELLEHAGYYTLYLGPNVPLASLPGIVVRLQPKVVAFTATMREAGRRLPQAIEAVRLADPAVRVLVGGLGVPKSLTTSDSLTIVRGATDVVDAVDALVRRASLN